MLGRIGYAIARALGRARPVVAVLRVDGPLLPPERLRGGVSLESLRPRIDQAFSLPGLKAVAIVINSPGGTPVQAALIMRHLRRQAARHHVPLLAFIEDVAASGGYLVALAADEIIAHPASLVGSIGVVSAGFGFAEAIARLGIERRIHTSAPAKVRLDPFLPEREEDVAWLAGLQERLHAWFRRQVEERRGRRLKRDEAERLFSGDVWLAEEAAALGLIDGVGELDEVLRARFGRDIRLRHLDGRRKRLSELLRPVLAGPRAGAQAGEALPVIGGRLVPELFAELERDAFWRRFGL